ncbi:MAG: hypothetical protein JWM56_704 [Candidatus Peribacteria bacterium]|nr:hypothetical protein [Candidatus Peribacteria bacterium]
MTYFLSLLAILVALPCTPLAYAATGDTLPVPPVQAVIESPTDIAVGRTMILTASRSIVPAGFTGKTEYEWHVADQTAPISNVVDAVYTPEKPGRIMFTLTVRLVTNDAIISQSTVTKEVVAYRRKLVLVTDPTVSAQMTGFQRDAAEQAGTYLQILRLPDPVLMQQNYERTVAFFSQNSASLTDANAVILWMDGVTGLQAYMQAARANADWMAAVRKQSILVVSSTNLHTLARAANGPFSVLRPQRIVLIRPEALQPLLLAPSITDFLVISRERGLDYLVLDTTTVGVRPWNLLSWLVNYMLVQGVSSQTIVLLLMLSVIATILAFLKQVIGVITFGLFAPSIIALSMLALGWWVGLLFLVFIITTGYLTRAAMQRWHLLYIPKVAIILSVVSITLLLLLGIGAAFGIVLSRDSVFILLILSTLGESFLTAKTEQGLKGAILSVSQTIGSALLCVIIVQWPAFQALILAYPELILLTLPVNFFLGRWTGLRLVEYFRFQEVFRHLYEE